MSERSPSVWKLRFFCFPRPLVGGERSSFFEPLMVQVADGRRRFRRPTEAELEIEREMREW